MNNTIKQKEKVRVNKNYLEDLERKKSFLEDLLVFIEDRSLGFLMEKTEKEENVSLFEAKKCLK